MINVTFYLEKPPYKINLGYEGENQQKQIGFNWEAWSALYQNASISLYFRRPDMDVCYPIIVDSIANPLIWSPDSTALAVPGDGEIIIKLLSDDTPVKTVTIYTKTFNSPGQTRRAPSGWSEWLTKIEKYANEINDFATAAIAAQLQAALAKQEAERSAAEAREHELFITDLVDDMETIGAITNFDIENLIK